MYTQIGQRDQKRKFVFTENKTLLMKNTFGPYTLFCKNKPFDHKFTLFQLGNHTPYINSIDSINYGDYMVDNLPRDSLSEGRGW
jgi:hypothetical protein